MRDRPIALKFSSVSFSYPHLDVLSDVTFHFHSGEFIALVGPNGSGKTTLLKLILGLEEPTQGTVELLGHPPKRSRSLIGYVPQHASYDPSFSISVAEVVRMGVVDGTSRRKRGQDDVVAKALSLVQMESLGERPYSELSGGQRRRVLVARALVGEPAMLILDEPAANMDRESERRLYDTLSTLKGETTILIVTHDMRQVSALVDRVFCIDSLNERTGTRTVIQHPLEEVDDGTKRVLHEQAIPADQCWQEVRHG